MKELTINRIETEEEGAKWYGYSFTKDGKTLFVKISDDAKFENEQLVLELSASDNDLTFCLEPDDVVVYSENRKAKVYDAFANLWYDNGANKINDSESNFLRLSSDPLQGLIVRRNLIDIDEENDGVHKITLDFSRIFNETGKTSLYMSYHGYIWAQFISNLNGFLGDPPLVRGKKMAYE